MGFIILLNISENSGFERNRFKLKKYLLIDWYFKFFKQGWNFEQGEEKIQLNSQVMMGLNHR